MKKQYVGVVIYFGRSTVGDSERMELQYCELFRKPSFKEALAHAKAYFDFLKSKEGNSNFWCVGSKVVMYAVSPVDVQK